VSEQTSDSPSPLAIALRLWPQARDRGTVDDPEDLDRLLATLGQSGAPGFADGVVHTFACFPPTAAATLTLPTGERPATDEAARFMGHVLVTRVLLAAGLSIDRRVSEALAAACALSWARRLGGHYGRTPLEMATALWLPALDPDGASDRPLPIDWSPACYANEELWDPDYRLFSHYDIRERALDWAMWVAFDPARRAGVSLWTIVEPLLRLAEDGRARYVLAQLAAGEDSGESAPAAAMLERHRIATLLRQFMAGDGDAPLRAV